MNKTPALILSIAIALASTAAIAQQPGMKVNVLIVESAADFERWLQQSITALEKKTAPPASYPPSLKVVPANKKVHFPIVVGGLLPPQQGEVKLVADVEFFGPDGKSVYAAQQCCRFTITNRPDFRSVLLGPTTNLELEPGDKKGAYTVRVSVSDGSRSVSTSETFQFVEGKPAAPPPAPAATAAPKVPAATTAPKLRMGTPPAKNPGRDVDKRDCLALPTTAEIVKCTEKK
jgi:hypothetical protein